MEIGLYVLLGIILVILLGLGFYLWKKDKTAVVETNDGSSALIQKDIENSKAVLELKIEALQKEISESKQTITNTLNKFDGNNSDFNKNLTSLNEKFGTLKTDLNKQDTELKNDLGGQKEKISKSFSEVMTNLTILTQSTQTLKEVENKVKDLNNVFLNSNKTRGNLGEYLLEKLLSDLYGETHELWELQRKLPDGNIIDAIVKTSVDKEDIAIDSKFPLTNYNNYLKAEDKFGKEKYLKEFKKDFKTKVEEVAKYINRKNEISSAIMFIPSEDIFAFVYSEFQDEVIKFAFNKKVWITSPTTMTAILFVLDKHLKDSKFNKNLELIRLNLLKIKDEFDRWTNRWEDFKKALEKINQEVIKLDTTHQKISTKYQNIYKDHKLEVNQDQ